MINNLNTETELYSLIPGTVKDILVKEGDSVKEGQPLLILEAMKMRNRIPAEYDGKVKKIHIKKEQRIPKNHLMIEYE